MLFHNCLVHCPSSSFQTRSKCVNLYKLSSPVCSLLHVKPETQSKDENSHSFFFPHNTVLPSLHIITWPGAELFVWKPHTSWGCPLLGYEGQVYCFQRHSLLCLVQLPVLLEKSRLYVRKMEASCLKSSSWALFISSMVLVLPWPLTDSRQTWPTMHSKCSACARLTFLLLLVTRTSPRGF